MAEIVFLKKNITQERNDVNDFIQLCVANFTYFGKKD
jgi:hypothetical protein